MIMEPVELEQCFKLLRAYWPGEWDEARYLVWADAFSDLSHDEAQSGIVAMGHNVTFPTVAAFFKTLGNVRRDGEGGMFIAGTGWARMLGPSAEYTPPDRDAVVTILAEARARLRQESA